MKSLQPKVIHHAGVSIDISQVKCFKLSPFTSDSEIRTLIIEFKKRVEYIYNSQTEQFEKQEINDLIEVEFPDWDIAKQYTNEWEEIWQDYLTET